VATRLLNRCFIENSDPLRSRGEGYERLGGSAHRVPVTNEDDKIAIGRGGWSEVESFRGLELHMAAATADSSSTPMGVWERGLRLGLPGSVQHDPSAG
jgi:hypothetical protein